MTDIKANTATNFDFPSGYTDFIITGDNTLTNTAFCICHIMDDDGLPSQTCPDRSLWQNGMYGLMDMFLVERWIHQKTQELSIWACTNDITLYNDMYGILEKRMINAYKTNYFLTQITNGLQDGANAMAELNYNLREQWKNTELLHHNADHWYTKHMAQ